MFLAYCKYRSIYKVLNLFSIIEPHTDAKLLRNITQCNKYSYQDDIA